MFTIDIHTHILPENLPGFKKKFGYGGFINLDHHKPSCARVMVADKFFREIEDNCWSAEKRMKECDHHHVDVQVLSTIPVMFCYWAKPKDGLEVAQVVLPLEPGGDRPDGQGIHPERLSFRSGGSQDGGLPDDRGGLGPGGRLVPDVAKGRSRRPVLRRAEIEQPVSISDTHAPLNIDKTARTPQWPVELELQTAHRLM